MVIVAALGAAFLLVWAAVVGPGHVTAQPVQSGHEQPVEQQHQRAEQGADDSKVTSDDQQKPHGGPWVQDLVAVVLTVVGLVILTMILRQLFLVIGRRFLDERLVVPLEPLPDLDLARSAVEREHGRQREALATPDVRNGIVACWVVFEEAAAASQVVKQPAETASAFVVRFLHSLDVDPRPVGVLAGLFLEARFSSHPMAADARTRAEQALEAIHHDLAGSRVTS